MSASLQVPAPFKYQEYTLAEIDTTLNFIAEIVRTGNPEDRKQAVRRANQWLDIRNKVTGSSTNV